MGWGNCGTDSRGRPIGYSFEGTCDHPGCKEKIDRGLAYACGGMHGDDEYSCEKYFCYKHKTVVVIQDESTRDGECISVCQDCYKILEENDLIENEEKEFAEGEGNDG